MTQDFIYPSVKMVGCQIKPHQLDLIYLQIQVMSTQNDLKERKNFELCGMQASDFFAKVLISF